MQLSGDVQFYLKMHRRLFGDWLGSSAWTRWGSLQCSVVVVVIA